MIVGAVAGIALAALLSLQLGATQQQEEEEPQQKQAEPMLLPLGERVSIRDGTGSELTGQLVAQDRDWLVVKAGEVGETTFWLSRSQVVYVRHPATEVAAPAEAGAPGPAAPGA